MTQSHDPTPTSREPDAGVSFDPTRRQLVFTVSEETRVEIERLKALHGVEKTTDLLRLVVAQANGASNIVPPPLTPEPADAGQVEGDADVERAYSLVDSIRSRDDDGDLDLGRDEAAGSISLALAIARRGASLPASSAPQAEENLKEIERVFSCALNYLRRHNPCNMAEDDSQQWQSAHDQLTLFGPRAVEKLRAGDRPVATFHRPEDAAAAVEAMNAPPPRPDPATDGGWRDIASAPKDGTRLLCLTVYDLRVGKFEAEYNIGLYDASGNSDTHGWFTVEGGDITPTHWYALPAPPEPLSPKPADAPFRDPAYNYDPSRPTTAMANGRPDLPPGQAFAAPPVDAPPTDRDPATDALRKIAELRHSLPRETIHEGNAVEAVGRLNRHILGIFDMADAALAAGHQDRTVPAGTEARR